MPIYEYVCHDCGVHFEALRLMRESDSPIGCKQCESLNTSRQQAVRVASCSGRGGGVSAAPAVSSGGGCAGCSGGSCGSCRH